jgi:hypothetical protein
MPGCSPSSRTLACATASARREGPAGGQRRACTHVWRSGACSIVIHCALHARATDGGPQSSHQAHDGDLEVAAAELYVLHRLSTPIEARIRGMTTPCDLQREREVVRKAR